MKIMIVTPYFYPKIGGVEKYVLNIALGLKNDYGWEVFIVTSGKKGGSIQKQSFEGMTIYRLPYNLKISNTPIGFTWRNQIKRIVHQENPDIINAHTPVPGLADMAFLSRGGCKFVITHHSGSLKKGNFLIDIPLRIYEKTILRTVLKKATAVVAVYPQYIEELVHLKNPANFIPPGVDMKVFQQDKDVIKAFDVIFVGRMQGSLDLKGVRPLLEAISILARSIPNISLKIVGDGSAVKKYKKLARDLGISENVTFSGNLEGEALVEAYNSARLLVLPSKTEAFGIVLIEAMACKLPVIGSNTDGIPNVIKDGQNGFLVKPGDPVALSYRILELLTDAGLANSLGQEGSRIVRDNFTSISSVNKTEALFSVCNPITRL